VFVVFALNEQEQHHVLRELKTHVVLRCRYIEDGTTIGCTVRNGRWVRARAGAMRRRDPSSA
jgi:hypothetical protein